MYEKKMKELEQGIEDLKKEIGSQENKIKDIESLLEAAKQQASVSKKRLRRQGVRTSSLSVPRIEDRLISAQIRLSDLEREKNDHEKELKELKNQSC